MITKHLFGSNLVAVGHGNIVHLVAKAQYQAVLGIGPVGLMAVRAAVLRGAGKVFAIGSRKGCFEVAQAYGATHLVDYHHEDYLQQILTANGGPVDGVVLCGGAFASDPAVMGWLFQQ